MSTFSHLQSRILTHYPAIQRLQAGQLPAPRFMILYPTYNCPADCTYCEYQNDLGSEEMETDLARQVIQQASQFRVQGVELCGGGEPTTHPEIMLIVQSILDTGMKLGLLTNGFGLVRSKELRELVAKRASYVRISIDAATPQTYSRVKGLPPAIFGDLQGAIKLLVADRGYSSRCKISGKFLITEENYTEIPEMAKLCRRLGLDSAQFKLARHTTKVSDTAWIAATGLLEYTKKRMGRYPVIGDFYHPEMRNPCWLCSLHTLVDADGSVYLCCYFRHRKETHRIGNLEEAPLWEIWDSPRHHEALASIEPTECDLFDCRFVKYHEIVESLIVHGEGQFEFL